MRLGDLHAIVVGAATGGAGAALLLARAGARVTLVEKVEQPRAVGAGIALAENGLAVLESLGLGPSLDVAAPVSGMRITDARGSTLVDVPKPHPRVVMLRRSTLQSMLLDAIAREPRVEAHFGAEAVAGSPRGTVTLRQGTATREVRGGIVICADGARSVLRDAGSFGARVRTGIRYVRALLESDRALGVEAWTSIGLFGSFRVDRGGTYFFSSCGTPALRAAVEQRDAHGYRREWTRVYPASAPLLESLRSWDPMLVNDVIRVDCRRFIDGHLVLLGDSAHAMAPNVGQGANSALVDAAVLLHSLRTAADLESALGMYDARRRPAVRKVAELASRLGMLAELTNPVARALRDRVVMPLASRFSGPSAMPALLQESPDWLRAQGATRT